MSPGAGRHVDPVPEDMVEQVYVVYACGLLVAIAQSRFSRIALFTFSMAATKLAHSRANRVLKYLCWRNTDAQGQSPIGYRGEHFDLDPQSKYVGVGEWKPEVKGQTGKFMEYTLFFASVLLRLLCILSR